MSVLNVHVGFVCVHVHVCIYILCYSFTYRNLTRLIAFNSEVCKPSCKFGICNTTIGECVCPPGHSGADCSVRGMLCVCTCVCVCVCVIILHLHASVHVLNNVTILILYSNV